MLIKTPFAMSRSEKIREIQNFWKAVSPALVFAVEASFMEGRHPMRHITQAEVTRRTGMAKKIAEDLRKTHGWSVQRIKDSLDRYLNLRLSGFVLDLNAESRRSSW